jgi:hypothetical protein
MTANGRISKIRILDISKIPAEFSGKGSFDIQNSNSGYPKKEFQISRFTTFAIQNSLLNVNSAARNLFRIFKSALLDVQNSNNSCLKFEFLIRRIRISDLQTDGGM